MDFDETCHAGGHDDDELHCNGHVWYRHVDEYMTAGNYLHQKVIQSLNLWESQLRYSCPALCLQ